LATRKTSKQGDEALEPSTKGSPPETSIPDLEPTLTENLTFTVALPVDVHTAPDHEVAVAIHDVAINPEFLDHPDVSTQSIAIVPEQVLTIPEVPSTDPVIPPLPESDQVYSRRSRAPGEVSAVPEPAGMLTAERLVVQPKTKRRPPPEGFLQELLYKATLQLVNIGDSYRVRERKSLDARIGKPFEGSTRFVPVLTRKGGVGKTTISALLGMALADVREDRVIAIDANPDRGTLAERVERQTRATVRDVVGRAGSIQTFSEFQTLISRDETRLHVLASDSEPTVMEAFDEYDYNAVANVAERFYSLVITDCGTGIVHSVMRATLHRADSVVIVSGGSVDEAKLASETLTWLETNGYADLVKNAVVALNTATHGTNLVKLEEIEAHFKSRVREIVRVPYDPALATGSLIRFNELQPLTRNAARELAALVVDGLPERKSV
jgi:MinD-like ATPase involved in chromosome partitioning or flagellar assembly